LHVPCMVHVTAGRRTDSQQGSLGSLKECLSNVSSWTEGGRHFFKPNSERESLPGLSNWVCPALPCLAGTSDGGRMSWSNVSSWKKPRVWLTEHAAYEGK
jgi:hypothetical protein